MKLALIGGGGVRSPEFVRGALAFAADIGLQELWLMDIEADRLKAMVPLCRQIVEQANSPFSLHQTTRLEEALRDAHMIVTTIRVGGEHGRVLDERIALKHNVLGQETTGPGGFSMAMRSIPALLEVAEQTEHLAPRAWTFNFTNPAGLVSQALHDSGFHRIVGICDSANTAQYDIAHWLEVPTDTVKTEVFGLNHLSWTRSARIKGKNVLPALLQDDDFIQATHLRFFGPYLARNMGMFLNEYLYYYYFRDVAVERIKEEELTRGEEVEVLNKQLFETLHQSSPNDYLRVYDAYNKRRSASYMAYAETDEALRQQRTHPTETTALLHQTQDDVGGYAGVALRTALAISQDLPLRIGLNVPNEGSIPTMHVDDVVEVTCEVDGSGIKPVNMGDIPEHADLLMRSVKYYERLAVRAILDRDRELAVEAMASHPLVGSYSLGQTLVDEYLDAHQEYTGEWHRATSL